MIRNPARRFGDTYSGSFAVSRCNWRTVPFESMLEMHWLLQTDLFTFDLVSLDAQPCEVGYWFDGNFRVWIPDFRVRITGRSRAKLVEVKPLLALYPSDPSKRAWISARFAAMENAADARGDEFEVVTKNKIRVQPRLHNAKLMLRVSARHFPAALESAGLSAVLQLPHRAKVRDLQRVLGPGINAMEVALRLAWRGFITLDPRVRWSLDTTFERSDRSLS